MKKTKRFFSCFLIFVVYIGMICCSSCDLIKKETYYQSDNIIFSVSPKRAEDITENEENYGVYGAYGKHVMDNMIMLLNSETFAMRLKEIGDFSESTDEIIESIHYSYTSANEHVCDFIYVQITVLEDAEIAEKLLECLKTAVPEYIEETMVVPSGYVGTTCEKISSGETIHEFIK